MDFSEKSNIVVTHGLFASESSLIELNQLGFPIKEENRLNLVTEGSLKDCITLNLKLRTAHRVLFEIGSFRTLQLDDLYWKIRKIKWNQVIPADGYFSVNSFVNQQGINDSRIVNLKVKDAIADYFMMKYDKRPDSGSERTSTVLFIHWSANECKVFIDTSGESIARHGYRKMGWKAPLSEALAAAIILETGWKFEEPFINPMCGSGTLAIEAALLATNRFPGLFRSDYGFQHIVGYEDDLFNVPFKTLSEEIKPMKGLKIRATDHHGGAVRCAKQNAEIAGVDDLIDFEICDFSRTPLYEPPGIIIMNPEYGERLGEVDKLSVTYKEIGDFFKQKAGGYTGFVFTGNNVLGKKIGLRTKRKIPFMNGNLECRLLAYELYAGSKKDVNLED